MIRWRAECLITHRYMLKPIIPPSPGPNAKPMDSAASPEAWRAQPIFISSTFLDMHAERDVLCNRVFYRLEEELRKRRHHLEAIDLRLGVETSRGKTDEERELLVLKVCLGEIERSRPFLLVLLGDRYGWLPPQDRLATAAREQGFACDLDGKSVTALEIEFGLLKKDAEQRRRSLFFFRKPLPYAQMPPGQAARYNDEFSPDPAVAACHDRLEALKKKLKDDPELAPHIFEYSAQWDATGQRVTGLEAFEELVFKELWAMLEEETRTFAAQPPTTWEEQERAGLAEFVELWSYGFVGREDTLAKLETIGKSAAAKSGDGPLGACVTGPAGSGKSALFAGLHRRLSTDSTVLLLANAFGSTLRGAKVDSMLRRWVYEMASFLKAPNPLGSDATLEEVEGAFHSLLERAAASKRVVLLLDALDQAEPTPRGQFLTWLKRGPWPRNARLLATALPSQPASTLAAWAGVETMELPSLTPADAEAIGKQTWLRHHREINPKVLHVLLEKTSPGGEPASGNPLWLTLALEQLNLLDEDDFRRAEGLTGPPEARLLGLMLDEAERMPADVPGLYQWLFDWAAENFGKTRLRTFLAALALSRHGWRESDLLALMPRLSAILRKGPDKSAGERLQKAALQKYEREAAPTAPPADPEDAITMLELASLRRAFRLSLMLRHELQWDFFHREARESALACLELPKDTEKALHREIAIYLQELSYDDPVHCDEVGYHLLRADEFGHLQMSYGATWFMRPRQVAATTDTLIEEVQRYGMKRLMQISNIDVSIGVSVGSGELTPKLKEEFDFARRDIQRSAAKEWRDRCLVNLMPALRSVATVKEREAFVDSLHRRLLDSEKDFPNDNQLRADNALMKGDNEMERGNLESARQEYERARDAADPTGATFAIACDKVGDVARARDQFAVARASYEKALPVFRKLAEENSGYRRDVSLCLSKLGELAIAEEDFVLAGPFLEEHIALARKIAASDPKDEDFQRDLAGAHERHQRLATRSGDLEKARHHAEEAHKIVSHLADFDPGNVTNIQDMGGSAFMYGMLLDSMGRREEAAKFVTQGVEVFEKLDDAGQLDAKGRRLLPGLASAFFKFGDLGRALSLACRAVHALAAAPHDPNAAPFVSLAHKILDKALDQQLNDAAEKLCDLMLPFCTKLEGEHSPSVANLLNVAGILRKRRGDLEGAESYYIRAYEEICRLMGPDSPAAAVGLRNLKAVMNMRQQEREKLLAASSGGSDALAVQWSHQLAHAAPIMALAGCFGQRRFVSGGADLRLVIWDLATLKPIIQMSEAHEQPITGVAMSEDGKRMASCSWDRKLKHWDTANPQPLHTLENKEADLCGVAMAPDGSVVVACEDGAIKKWDGKNNAWALTVRWHMEAAMSLAIAPHANAGVSGGNDGMLRIWESQSMSDCAVLTADGQFAEQVPSLLQGRVLIGFRGAINTVAITPDGRFAASGGVDGKVRIWDWQGLQLLHTLAGHDKLITAVVLSADGSHAASASFDKTVRLWDVKNGRQLAGYNLGEDIMTLCASPDFQTLIAGGQSGYLHIARLQGL